MAARALPMIAALVAVASAAHAVHAQPAAPECRPAGPLVRVSELPEASGITASRRSPGMLWALNDSGEPVIHALDEHGAVAGRVRLTGAKVEDWEAIAAGPCPSGSCIHVADIGDNDGRRKDIVIYRLAEPAATGESTAAAEVFHATYADGAHDAEAFVITTDGTWYIITKGVNESVALYRFPPDPKPGSTVQLQRVAKPRETAESPNSERVTDAAASPQGDWIVLRTNRAVSFHRPKELMAGNWRPAQVVDLADLDEPQGEGVTFAGNDSIVITGEGGGKSAPGTFARLSCTSLR